jgi:hypothetical protein
MAAIIGSWNPVFVKELAVEVQSYLEKIYVDGAEYTDEEGIVDLKIDTEVESALESVLDEKGLSGINATEDFNQLFDLVKEQIPGSFFSDIEDGFRDEFEEAELYNRNPLHYYGMRQSDFI